MEAFDHFWLSRYPRPRYVGFDNGGEFKKEFLATCANYGITEKPTTTYNPQANGILERVHLVLGNMLRTLKIEKEALERDDPWSPFLSSAAWAIRSTYHMTLEATPGQLVFGCDMLCAIAFKLNWERICQNKQELIDNNKANENMTHIDL